MKTTTLSTSNTELLFPTNPGGGASGLEDRNYVPLTTNNSGTCITDTVGQGAGGKATSGYIHHYPNTFQAVNSMKSVTTTKISGALLRAQSKMSNAVKDSSNPFFKSKYADLNAVREACQTLLNGEGVLISQPVIQKDGKNYLRTELTHAESGEFVASDVEIVCAKQNDPQALGSAITYARRYGLQALVGLGAEDDDGNLGSGKTNSSESPKSSAPRASFRKPAVKPATNEGGKADNTPVEGWE